METAPDLDLGNGVTAAYTCHAGHARAGLLEWHLCTGGNCRDRDTGQPRRCGGSILFDLPGMQAAFPGRFLWQVFTFDPLTISPSVKCGCHGCTHHGFIYGGKWVPV